MSSSLVPSGRLPGEGIDTPSVRTEERAALQAFLDRQRELIDWKVRGCEAATLQTASTPSGMTPLGVVQHLLDVERSWWRERVAGQTGLETLWSPQDPDADWRVDPGTTTEQILDAYAAECRRCDATVADLPLDQVGVGTRFTVRWVYLHMIEEAGRHLGHLDVLREQADGSVGEEPRGG